MIPAVHDDWLQLQTGWLTKNGIRVFGIRWMKTTENCFNWMADQYQWANLPSLNFCLETKGLPERPVRFTLVHLHRLRFSDRLVNLSTIHKTNSALFLSFSSFSRQHHQDPKVRYVPSSILHLLALQGIRSITYVLSVTHDLSPCLTPESISAENRASLSGTGLKILVRDIRLKYISFSYWQQLSRCDPPYCFQV